MEQGDLHSFPRSVEGFQGAGQVNKIIGGNGATREILKISGSFKGKEGVFEFIKEADGMINCHTVSSVKIRGNNHEHDLVNKIRCYFKNWSFPSRCWWP